MDCSYDAAYGLIYTAINAGDSTDCANITISDDAAYVLIATAIDTGGSTDCSDNAAGGFIADIDVGNSTDCADIMI